MALTGTIVDIWSDTKRLHVTGTIAAAGSYTTGGMAFNPLTALTTTQPGVPSTPIPGNKVVVFASIQGIAGYDYKFDKANNKILIRQSGTVTPAGTISKPTFTVTKGAILASSELGLSADAATATVNNDTIAATLTLTTNSPVSAPTFTGTATTAAPMAELAATTLPSGVTDDTISCYFIFK